MHKPVTAIPASTILPIRDSAQGIEIFMMLRSKDLDFSSGALVFPGGAVDPEDSLVRSLCDGAETFSDHELSLRVAGIREMFEEAGILLSSEKVLPKKELIEKERDALLKAKVSFEELLKRHHLRLACDKLIPFAHWITPELAHKRYDTYFFLAEAPSEQLGLHDGYETVDSFWITPDEALQKADAGLYRLILPTRMNLRKLREVSTVADAMEMAKAQTIVTITPQVELRGSDVFLCIPPDAGYDLSEWPYGNVR